MSLLVVKPSGFPMSSLAEVPSRLTDSVNQASGIYTPQSMMCQALAIWSLGNMASGFLDSVTEPAGGAFELADVIAGGGAFELADVVAGDGAFLPVGHGEYDLVVCNTPLPASDVPNLRNTSLDIATEPAGGAFALAGVVAGDGAFELADVVAGGVAFAPVG
jgi:hypothetical protein